MSKKCRKSARRCGAKHISKSKCIKHTRFGPLLEVAMSKKCTPLWREAHFQVKSVKNWRSRTTFGGSDVEKVSKKCTPLWREAHVQVKMLKTPCQKWAKREGFVAFPKTMAGVGHLKRIWKDAFRVAGAVQETCSSEMWGLGADFLQKGWFWSVRSSGLLRWFCVTGAALCKTWHHFCVPGAALYTDGVEKKNRKTHWYEAAGSALNFPFLKEVP